MKQLFVLAIFVSLTAYSQDYAKQFAIPASHASATGNEDEGPYEVVIKTSNGYEPGYLNNIPSTVLREFVKTYPAANNISWFLDEKTSTVYFDSDNKVCIVKFKNDGVPVLTKKSYGSKSLNPRLATFLKDEIAGYDIRYISEVIRETIHKYEINMVKNGVWMILRIGEDTKGNFEVTGKQTFDKN